MDGCLTSGQRKRLIAGTSVAVGRLGAERKRRECALGYIACMG
jgi:hypothetical protein